MSYSRNSSSKTATQSIHEDPAGLQLSRFDPAFEEQMHLAREIMNERRAVLSELAK